MCVTRIHDVHIITNSFYKLVLQRLVVFGATRLHLVVTTTAHTRGVHLLAIRQQLCTEQDSTS